MAIRKVSYKEPKGYFNEDMRKAAKEWDEKHGKSEASKNSSRKQQTAKKK